MQKFIDWISTKLLNQKKERFSTKFLLIFFFVLPLIIIAALSIFNSYKELGNFTLERRQTIAYLAASTVHEKLERVIDVGLSLSNRVQFQNLIEAGKWDEANKIMEKVPQIFPYIDRVSLFDKQGFLRAATNPTPELTAVIGKDFSYRDYYQGVSKKWEPYVAETIKPAVPLGYNLIPVAIPIKSEPNEVLGFLLLSIKLDSFAIWAKSIDVGSEGLIYIVDSKGHLVAHPTLLPAEDVVDFSSVPSVQKVLKGERGVEIIFNSIENQERLTAYEPVPDYGWGVVLAQPTRAAFADRNREVRKLSILYGLMILFGLFLGYVFLKLLHSINSYRQKENILLESIGDGVAAIDRFWNIVLWNKAAEKISGWTKDEVVGKPLRNFLKLIRERDRTENVVFIEEAIVYGRVGFLENNTFLITKSGNEIPVGDSAAPIFDSNGVVTGAIIVFRDASKEKEMGMIKSDFAYASHQLNTPITKTLWLLDSAWEETDIVKIKEKVGTAYQSALSIQKLGSQLLAVSQVDQKLLITKMENVKLVGLFDEILKLCGPALKVSKNINIESEPISGVLGIKTDHKLFTMLMFEIIDNAIKYGKAGGSIKIKNSIEGNNLILTIEDTGIGISTEQQALIFTKFFRGNNFDTTGIVGAGLGLFLAREYAKLLGGKIWFTSEQNKGTTFFVSLPLT